MLGSELPIPIMELKISGAPLPNARKVTPAMLSDSFSDFDIDTSSGHKLKTKQKIKTNKKSIYKSHKKSFKLWIYCFFLIFLKLLEHTHTLTNHQLWFQWPKIEMPILR